MTTSITLTETDLNKAIHAGNDTRNIPTRVCLIAQGLIRTFGEELESCGSTKATSKTQSFSWRNFNAMKTQRLFDTDDYDDVRQYLPFTFTVTSEPIQ